MHHKNECQSLQRCCVLTSARSQENNSAANICFDTLNQSTMVPNHYTLLGTFYLTHSANQVSKIGKNQIWYLLPWFILPHFHPCFFARIYVFPSDIWL